MGWSGITSVTIYSAGNAQTISVQAGEMVRIRTIRPATGPDGEVVIYDQTGTAIQTITVSKSNPDQMTEFATSATSLNYSTTVAFDSPGLQISWQESEATPSYDPSTGNTVFWGAVVAPEFLAPVPWDVPKPVDRLLGVPTICVGSSTTEQFTTANLPTDKPQEASDGVFGCVQQRYGSPFYVVRAGFRGVGGVLTGPVGTASTVLAQLNSGLALAGAPDTVIFQPGGNDNISDAAGLAQLIRYVEQGIQISLAAGVKRIFLIQQHLKVADIPNIAQYLLRNAAYAKIVDRFYGRVFLVDHWSRILLPDGSGPNTAYLDATGVHLNAAGALAVVPAWELPLQRSGLYPSLFSPLDPRSFPSANLILSTNPLFEDETTGAFSSTGWAGVASFSSIAESPVPDQWGRKQIRVTQIGGTAAYLRQTYDPSIASLNNGTTARIVRAIAAFVPRQNVGRVGLTIRDSSGSAFTCAPMNAQRGTDRVALENGKQHLYVSAPFQVTSAFFAANSRLDFQITPSTADAVTPAICDASGVYIARVADTWA